MSLPTPSGFNHREKLVQAITSPLCFYALALLVAESPFAVLLICNNLEPWERGLCLALGAGMFVIVVRAVTGLVLLRPKNLTYDKDAHLNSNDGKP